MRVALFVPCYIDQFFPRVGVASLRLLRSLGYSVEVPLAQVCCGQPLVNGGAVCEAASIMKSFVEVFSPFDCTICPSASCVSMVRHHYQADSDVRNRIFELCEFLYDVAGSPTFVHEFPRKVALHQGCHGLRELKLGACSELGANTAVNKVEALLRSVPGLELSMLERADECCGFGGTFSVMEPEVSCAMGRARLEDFTRSGADIIASTDMSCLMHLDGLLRRDGLPLSIVHVAEIFAGPQS